MAAVRGVRTRATTPVAAAPMVRATHSTNSPKEWLRVAVAPAMTATAPAAQTTEATTRRGALMGAVDHTPWRSVTSGADRSSPTPPAWPHPPQETTLLLHWAWISVSLDDDVKWTSTSSGPAFETDVVKPALGEADSSVIRLPVQRTDTVPPVKPLL